MCVALGMAATAGRGTELMSKLAFCTETNLLFYAEGSFSLSCLSVVEACVLVSYFDYWYIVSSGLKEAWDDGKKKNASFILLGIHLFLLPVILCVVMQTIRSAFVTIFLHRSSAISDVSLSF